MVHWQQTRSSIWPAACASVSAAHSCGALWCVLLVACCVPHVSFGALAIDMAFHVAPRVRTPE
jgi:hypothetical protein